MKWSSLLRWRFPLPSFSGFFWGVFFELSNTHLAASRAPAPWVQRYAVRFQSCSYPRPYVETPDESVDVEKKFPSQKVQGEIPIYIYHLLPRTMGSVEKIGPPKWKETNIGETHFPLNHDYGRKGISFLTMMFSWFLKVWNFLASCNCLRSFSSFIDCAKLARWATGSLWMRSFQNQPSTDQMRLVWTFPHQLSREKKTCYFPLNTGCLIGILIIFYYKSLI